MITKREFERYLRATQDDDFIVYVAVGVWQSVIPQEDLDYISDCHFTPVAIKTDC